MWCVTKINKFDSDHFCSIIKNEKFGFGDFQNANDNSRRL